MIHSFVKKVQLKIKLLFNPYFKDCHNYNLKLNEKKLKDWSEDDISRVSFLNKND